jgi:thioredoxin-dependent peroxiredoxin
VIGAGQAAPEFEGKGTDGKTFRLSDQRGHPVVLYFFPKADTPGCTIETKAFRDNHGAFHSHGVRIVGVSVDNLDEEAAFAKKCELPFPLVADPTKSIAGQYGVLGPSGHARRVTFYIGPDGNVVDVVDERSPNPHVERARELFAAP